MPPGCQDLTPPGRLHQHVASNVHRPGRRRDDLPVVQPPGTALVRGAASGSVTSITSTSRPGRHLFEQAATERAPVRPDGSAHPPRLGALGLADLAMTSRARVPSSPVTACGSPPSNHRGRVPEAPLELPPDPVRAAHRPRPAASPVTMVPSSRRYTTAGATTERSPNVNISTWVGCATAAATNVVPRSTPGCTPRNPPLMGHMVSGESFHIEVIAIVRTPCDLAFSTCYTSVGRLNGG